MSHQVLWTKVIVEEFVKEGCLSKEEEEILRTRAAGWTRVKQSVTFNMSLQKIDKIIKKLKVKYDEVQKYDTLLPPRKFSEKELYMDKVNDDKKI